MNKGDAIGLGVISGIIPAVWFCSYVFHAILPLPVFTWWSMPTALTIMAATFMIPILFGIVAALIWEHKHA